jgi:hypothetical protein
MFKKLGAGVAVAVLCRAGSLNAGAVDPRDAGRGIPTRIVRETFAVVPVTVNGTGPHPFLLDTGATTSMIDPALVARLGMATTGSAVQQTATRAARVDLIRVSLALGGVSRRDVEVIATPLDAVRALDEAIVGVLGQDLLRSANWWLDYRRRVLIADTEGLFLPCDLGERVAVHWEADRPAVEAVLPDRRPLRLVLDSAASSALLFRDGPGVAGEPAGSARITTHFGDATVAMVTIGPLRVGAHVMRPFPAAMMGSDARDPRSEDGLLPTVLFDSIYFDNQAGAVVLNPRRSSCDRAEGIAAPSR